MFVCFSLRVWVGSILFAACLFFTFSWVAARTHTGIVYYYCYRLVFYRPGFGWRDYIFYFESTPFYLLDTCFTGFLIARYLLPASCSEDRSFCNPPLEYPIFPIREKGLNSCRFLSGDLLLRIIVAFALSRDSCRQYKQDRAL